MPKIKVLIVAAELNPLAKVGGLADVIGALPKALAKLGIDVRIVIPKYGIINEQKYPLKKVVGDIAVPFKKGTEKITIFETPLPGSQVPVYLIDNYTYLGQNSIYFEKDTTPAGPTKEAERFTFFARASLSIFEPLGWYPDLIHCHDWHVSLVPALVKILARTDPKLQHVKTLLTIHNLEYQGRYQAATIFHALGLDEQSYPTLTQQHSGDLISLEQAILTSDFINTVSQTYAKEMLTPEFGAGLEQPLLKRKKELVGILNGIDVDHFDPATDPAIMAHYTAKNPAGKRTCKENLQKSCQLPIDANIPIIGIVSRLAEQKGLGLITQIAEKLFHENIQLVLLGTGSPDIEQQMRTIEGHFPKKVHTKIGFDAAFAQQIYAGADLFLMPSKFEPCGLGQMIAMRYGTVPIVRATGGLKDTVQDYNQVTNSGDGFVFEKYLPEELLEAIQRALTLYQDKEKWYNMVRHIMEQDFSWDHSARRYFNLYKKIL